MSETKNSIQGVVRLEVDMIETRHVTKEIEVSAETADRLVGKLWGYENKKGWSEEECCALIMRKYGKVTRERVYFECDTIDFMEPNHQARQRDSV